MFRVASWLINIARHFFRKIFPLGSSDEYSVKKYDENIATR